MCQNFKPFLAYLWHIGTLKNKSLFYNDLFFQNVPKMCQHVPKILSWLFSWSGNVPKMCQRVPKP
jgi:hypothetical protein